MTRAEQADRGRPALTARGGARRPLLACLLLGVLLGAATTATGQDAQQALAQPTGTAARPEPLRLTVDTDDDDDDGVPDGAQFASVPLDELSEVVLGAESGPLRISALGELRVIRQGIPIPLPATIPEDELPLQVFLQARAPSRRAQPLALMLERGGRVERVDVHAVGLRLLDASNRPLDPARQALGLALRVTNDRSLPRSATYDATSRGPRDVRVEVVDARAGGKRLGARIEAVNVRTGRVRSSLELELGRPRIGLPFRSQFVRLVGDQVDELARGVAGRVLRVGLRDRVRVVYEGGGRRADGSPATHSIRVGRPGHEDGPMAARASALRVVVLRTRPGGPPVIGVDDASALRIVRDEVSIANEIWLQCHVTFGPPRETEVMIADPPGPTLLSIADGDGLPAVGGGLIRFRVNGQPIGPIPTVAGASAQRTATVIARALKEAGLSATVTVNPKTVFGAAANADVLVRSRDGALVTIAAEPGVPLSSDLRQRLGIGEVDLGDGLAEFDNMTATSGSLEERTLIKALSDMDAETIDLFIVNRFTHGTRQGEAFIESSTGPIVNAVVLDRNGLRQRETAWTMAHEIGHVLLNQPLHPDNVGPDRPYLLMDSDNNRGTVNGPKRLEDADCQRMRHESGVDAIPALLRRYVD